ncbi:RmlC-like cupins superfamily protein [Klebsormidium nitens]|uniref:RmlC-like cupins superfamily protein n=1 Tax=Klebsormidium nitens TaxID=105231 RepID=A0A1Y1I503_KLENI|nr:RmlC-like cupins superfamily protein [Klebsormidium nitens]|eukprot:GAQ84499.1 RmlC-like cupins superfamily protein [Klebsormidium nitens]
MASTRLTFEHVLLACSLLVCLVSVVAYHGYTSGDFVPGQPSEYMKSDGGFESNWGSDTDTKPLIDEDFGTWILVMEPSTLRPPHFVDAHMLMAVLQGTARAGILNDKGEETGVRSFRRGDVIALPAGHAVWILNNDTQQKFSMLGGVRPVTVPREPSKWEAFPLVAGEVSGKKSILHGFTKDVLAEAFNVDEGLVEDVRSKAPETSVSVSASASDPVLRLDKLSAASCWEMVKPARARTIKLGAAELLAMEHELSLREQQSPHKDDGYIYNIDKADPDYEAEGGQVTLLDSKDFPILKNLTLGAVKTSLKPGAMVLPHYDPTSSLLGFITAGRARIQVAQPDGSTGTDEELGPGEVFVVPRFFPLVQKSVGDHNLEWIGFTTTACSRMKTVFLAGKKSVYKSVPNTILAAATDLDKTKIKQWLENQPEECIAQREKSDGEELGEVEIVIEEIVDGLGRVKGAVIEILEEVYSGGAESEESQEV